MVVAPEATEVVSVGIVAEMMMVIAGCQWLKRVMRLSNNSEVKETKVSLRLQSQRL
jgi:hypothetical protein